MGKSNSDSDGNDCWWWCVAVTVMENASDHSSSPLSTDEQSVDDKSVVTLRFITSSKVQFSSRTLLLFESQLIISNSSQLTVFGPQCALHLNGYRCGSGFNGWIICQDCLVQALGLCCTHIDLLISAFYKLFAYLLTFFFSYLLTVLLIYFLKNRPIPFPDWKS